MYTVVVPVHNIISIYSKQKTNSFYGHYAEQPNESYQIYRRNQLPFICCHHCQSSAFVVAQIKRLNFSTFVQ